MEPENKKTEEERKEAGKGNISPELEELTIEELEMIIGGACFVTGTESIASSKVFTFSDGVNLGTDTAGSSVYTVDNGKA